MRLIVNDSIDDALKLQLIEKAFSVRENAYAPYSGFCVAAAALFDSGKIYTGVNVENASYPVTSCAERNAIAAGIGVGEKRLLAVAIVGGPKGSANDYCPPCGMCRQVMREFGDPSALLVLMAKSKTQYREVALDELLPNSFGPDFLPS